MKNHKKFMKNDYESPLAFCIEFIAEGVLCSSTEDLIVDDSWIELLEE